MNRPLVHRRCAGVAEIVCSSVPCGRPHCVARARTYCDCRLATGSSRSCPGKTVCGPSWRPARMRRHYQGGAATVRVHKVRPSPGRCRAAPAVAPRGTTRPPAGRRAMMCRARPSHSASSRRYATHNLQGPFGPYPRGAPARNNSCENNRQRPRFPATRY